MFSRLMFITLCLITVLILLPGAKGWAVTDVQHIVVTHSSTYPPFSYLDEKQEPQGYLIDLWRAFGEANDISITFKLSVWQATLDMLKSGEAQIHGGLFFSEERDRFLDFGPTIMEVGTALYVKEGISMTNLARSPMGVVKGGYAKTFMAEHHPKQILVEFADTESMVRAANNGELSAFLSDQPTATHYLNNYKLEQTYISRNTIYPSPLRPAVQHGDHVVLDSVLYGWPNIDEQTRSRIYDRWFIRTSWVPAWLAPALAILVFLFVGIPVFRKLATRLYDIEG